MKSWVIGLAGGGGVPDWLAPSAPVAVVNASSSVTLGLDEMLPRTIYHVAFANGSGATVRNNDGVVLDNRLGSVRYDNYSRTVYIRPDKVTQAYLDTAGTGMNVICSFWSSGLVGHHPRVGATKTAPASDSPIPWTCVAGVGSHSLIVFAGLHEEWRRKSIIEWLVYSSSTL